MKHLSAWLFRHQIALSLLRVISNTNFITCTKEVKAWKLIVVELNEREYEYTDKPSIPFTVKEKYYAY
ncbi:MAG: hypothetical protein NPIRA05_17810 [Nitrospirales bacterium]|nr:MAG: hypothetical protein NPIRA05_17810 [Nitrospirales bacterium]